MFRKIVGAFGVYILEYQMWLCNFSEKFRKMAKTLAKIVTCKWSLLRFYLILCRFTITSANCRYLFRHSVYVQFGCFSDETSLYSPTSSTTWK